MATCKSNLNSPTSTSSEAEAKAEEFEDQQEVMVEVDHFTYSEVYANDEFEYV